MLHTCQISKYMQDSKPEADMPKESLLMPLRTYTYPRYDGKFRSRPESRGAPSAKSKLSGRQLAKITNGMDITIDECQRLCGAKPWPGQFVPPRRGPATVCVVNLLENSIAVLEWAYDIPDAPGPTAIEFAVAEIKLDETTFGALKKKMESYLSTF